MNVWWQLLFLESDFFLDAAHLAWKRDEREVTVYVSWPSSDKPTEERLWAPASLLGGPASRGAYGEGKCCVQTNPNLTLILHIWFTESLRSFYFYDFFDTFIKYHTLFSYPYKGKNALGKQNKLIWKSTFLGRDSFSVLFWLLWILSSF